MKVPINTGGAMAVLLGATLAISLTAFPISQAFATNENDISLEDAVEDASASEELPEDEAAVHSDSSTVDESEWEVTLTPKRNSTFIDVANGSFDDLYKWLI